LAPLDHGTICFSPDDAESDLRQFFPDHWKFRRQVGGELGARLQNAISESFAGGAASVIVIGSDCPYIQCSDIREASEELESLDVVFGPATDGGYWLVGLNRPAPALFEGISWGTNSVLAESLARAARLNLQVRLLRELSDIDTEQDWKAFLKSQS
ncbi:MAG TPA: TIGR04282 family arsenosugar biosynthesis glycosyltransferase, partial [Candidatus Kapabacteria bacterium]|nr:TIGR04282 family arsenosugar biosynthesis glycosyltransferase [Candidatus Kapabacteria bacterium]